MKSKKLFISLLLHLQHMRTETIFAESIKCPGDGTGNCTQSIRITAQRDGIADGILVGLRFQEGDDGFRNRALAGTIKVVH